MNIVKNKLKKFKKMLDNKKIKCYNYNIER